MKYTWFIFNLTDESIPILSSTYYGYINNPISLPPLFLLTKEKKQTKPSIVLLINIMVKIQNHLYLKEPSAVFKSDSDHIIYHQTWLKLELRMIGEKPQYLFNLLFFQYVPI